MSSRIANPNVPTDVRAGDAASVDSSPSSSPIQNRTGRRCRPIPSLSDSDSESDCSSGAVIPDGRERGPHSAPRFPRVRGNPRVAGGMCFLDDEAESVSEPESEPETEAEFESVSEADLESVSEADLESVSEVTSGLGSDTDSEPASEDSGDELQSDRPQQIRINIRLVSSPDRRAGVVFPESRGTRSSPGTDTPPSELSELSGTRAARDAERPARDEWNLDLRYMRRGINRTFRLLRRSSDPRGAADRLRRLIRDCYLMGYTRRRLEPSMWSRMLQVGGDRASGLRNTIARVVERVGDEGEILPLPLSPLRYHGAACDRSRADTGDDDDSRPGFSDLDTSGDSDATLESDSEGAPPSGPLDPPAPGMPDVPTRGPSRGDAHGSLASRLETEFAAFDWTSDEGSQPWLSSVVADTSSAERRRGDSPGPRRDRDAPGSCRRMRFPTTCPYPCGHTFLRM
ncbi:regulatory protein ICP22 [Macacine alphaherpesvirus 1]|uniref:Regulatory protein ICP22 n=1 Tax=Macacine alphaherpesvirus 2 TaxID=2845554 RepID=A0A1X9WF51_9ALPH|nr:regulatory protein ICP22 [Macacine alphaherpesvirus 1]ARS01697.1 regulatory protein ICP22 [Macacine alphaherpesvirus 2]